MRRQGIDAPYLKVLEDVFRESKRAIIFYNKSEEIPFKKGGRQGDTLSPKVFTAYLEEIFSSLECDDT